MTRTSEQIVVHALLVVGYWLAATMVYAVAFATPHPLWLAIDGAAVAGCFAVVGMRRDGVGFRSLGERRLVKLIAVGAIAVIAVAIQQALIEDANGVWVDEASYLATMRNGLDRTGTAPFHMRWLEPYLAGNWNVLAVDDVAALKALNFGGLAVTGGLLVLVVVRLGASLRVAATAPLFLLGAYLGTYAATNRLVLDPFNYAMFAVLLHTALRRDHAPLFAIALVVAACNSEKAVYWVPVYAALTLARDGGATVRHWRSALAVTAAVSAPAAIYLVAMHWYLQPSQTAGAWLWENAQVMAVRVVGRAIQDDAVRPNRFQTLWFPFGGFTIYALLGFWAARRAIQPLALLAVPILASTLVATDSERMVAYAFIVVLPFGLLYWHRAFDELPRVVAAIGLAVAVAIAIAHGYLLAIVSKPKPFAFALAIGETVVVAAMVFVHGVFGRRPS